MTATNDEKDALADLNSRFLCYVNKVRRLKDEEDVRIINENVMMLEEELRALKGSYEAQISQLTTTLDIVVAQKVDVEREVAARKNNEIQLSDRLAVEGARTTRLLHELSALRSEASGREQEAISLALAVQTLRMEAADGGGQRQRLQRELREAADRASRQEEQIRDYENRVSSLSQKINFQDHFFSKKVEDMRQKLEDYLQQMVETDFKMQEAKQRELQWPLTLERVQREAEQEYKGLKSEAEAFFDGRISSIQAQLDNEVAENGRLKQANDSLNSKLLQMRKAEAELQSKVEQLQRQSDILEQAFRKDKEDSGRTITSLQNKIKQLQDNFLQELDDVKTGRGVTGVQIKGEIEFLKRLLTEEEKRLHISTTHDGQGGDLEARDPDYHDNVEEVSEVDIDEHNMDRYVNNGSAEEFQHQSNGQQYRNYPVTFKHDQDNGQPTSMEKVISPGEVNPHDNRNLWDDNNEPETFVKTSTLVGPVHYADVVVGPVFPSPSVPHPPNERPPRPASANLRGIRSKTMTSQPDFVYGRIDCSSSTSSNLRADSGLGQSPDYFDSVFKNKSKEAPSHDDSTINLTSVRVMEVNKDGKYIRLCNTSETQDVEIGNYMIKQNRFGHPVALFRFPERVRLPASCTVTVWAGSNDPLLHQPPTDFFSEEPRLWGSGPEYTTILCSSLGQAVSWTSQPHRVYPDPFRARTAPAGRKEHQRDLGRRLPELAPGTTASDHIFLIREGDGCPPQPTRHPFTSTPRSAIHPCLEATRGGDGGTSLHRQGRQVDPGARMTRFYAGTIQPSHTISNRTPEVVFRSNTEPPSTFQKPLSRFLTGLDQVQSMHNQFYNPPMFKAETDASAT